MLCSIPGLLVLAILYIGCFRFLPLFLHLEHYLFLQTGKWKLLVCCFMTSQIPSQIIFPESILENQSVQQYESHNYSIHCLLFYSVCMYLDVIYSEENKETSFYSGLYPLNTFSHSISSYTLVLLYSWESTFIYLLFVISC